MLYFQFFFFNKGAFKVLKIHIIKTLGRFPFFKGTQHLFLWKEKLTEKRFPITYIQKLCLYLSFGNVIEKLISKFQLEQVYKIQISPTTTQSYILSKTAGWGISLHLHWVCIEAKYQKSPLNRIDHLELFEQVETERQEKLQHPNQQVET